MSDIFIFIYKQNIFLMALITVFLIYTTSAIAATLTRKRLIIASVSICIFTLIYIFNETVFSREVGIYEIMLIPFRFIIEDQSPNEIYRTFFMNALLFVPLGLSMPFVLPKVFKRINVVITIVFAMMVSALVEFLQHYYHVGHCETNDVIANTLGAAVGALSYLIYIRILKNREESLMNSKITDNQNLLMGLCSKALLDKEYYLPQDYNCTALVEEAVRQTVFSQIFSFVKDNVPQNANKRFSQIVAQNIRVEYAHNEAHRILSENHIPYVILKGVASASYYKEPMLRMMGDVDILVSPENIGKADSLLKSIGFVTTDDINSDDMHIGYKRKDGIACELHRRIGWAPKNEVGDTVLKYLSDIFEQGIEHNTSNGSCIIPNKFHHGLVLLLHTATHLTHEGVGLRHLCDWAVFINSFSNDEFINTFEKPLKEMGLWRFAQLLTLCCMKYLGCDTKVWAGQATNDLLEGIIADILNGGNFGLKDTDRYNQIKYIFGRKSVEKSKKSPVAQLFSSINEKTKIEFKFVNKSKILLPIGWICTVSKYFYMVVMGKRRLDSVATIIGAKQRKEIYSQFKLFEKDI